MRRRQFLAVVAAGAGTVQNPARAQSGDVCQKSGLLVAPHLDMFRHASGGSLTQQIAFMHACGFRAVDDNRLASRDADAQAEIGQAARRHGIAVGQFAGSVSFGESLFASGRSRDWRQVLGDLNRATGVGRRAGARYCTVVPGLADRSLNWNRQFHNARQLLDECSQLCASAGMTLLLESFRHPSPQRRMLIEDVHTACRVCQSLTRSTCRAVLDTCCQRLQPIHDLLAGPLASQVGYIQLADFPGRKEPGTGTIDFRSLLSSITDSGYVGLLGMEHGCSVPGEPGERITIDAYRQLLAADPSTFCAMRDSAPL